MNATTNDVVRPQVNTGALTALATSETTQQKLVCKNLLEGDTLVQAKADAAKVYPIMLDNPVVFATYGSDVLTAMNALVDRLYKDIRAGKNPEVGKIVKGISKSFDEVTHRYNAADPKFVAKYQDMHGGFLGFFGGLPAFWRMFMRDMKSIDAQLADAEEKIDRSANQINENIAYHNELYKTNTVEEQKVIRQIAVLELIIDEAIKDVESIPVGDTAAGDRGVEERARRSDLINNLQNKISAYKSRLFMAWNFSPQIRKMLGLDLGLHGTLTTTKNITFSSMKMVFVDIALLQRSKEAAQETEIMRQALNNSLQQFAVMAGVVVPEIARANSVPLMMAETIAIMRDSYIQQTNGIIKVVEARDAENAKLDSLYLETKKVINDQSDKVTAAIIDSAVSAASTPLEITTTVLAK